MESPLVVCTGKQLLRLIKIALFSKITARYFMTMLDMLTVFATRFAWTFNVPTLGCNLFFNAAMCLHSSKDLLLLNCLSWL